MLSKLTCKYEKRIILILYIINIVLTCRGWEMFVKTFMCVISMLSLRVRVRRLSLLTYFFGWRSSKIFFNFSSDTNASTAYLYLKKISSFSLPKVIKILKNKSKTYNFNFRCPSWICISSLYVFVYLCVYSFHAMCYFPLEGIVCGL